MHLSTIFYTESSFSQGLPVTAYQKRNILAAAIAFSVFGLMVASLGATWYLEKIEFFMVDDDYTLSGNYRQLNSTTRYYDLNGISVRITGINNVITANSRVEYSQNQIPMPRLSATFKLVQTFVLIALALSIVIIALLLIFVYDPIRFAYGNIFKRNILRVLVFLKLVSVIAALLGLLGLPDAFKADRNGDCADGPQTCHAFSASVRTRFGGEESLDSFGPDAGWYIILYSIPTTLLLFLVVFFNHMPLTLSKHHRMIFRKKYPNVTFSTIAAKSNPATANIFNLFGGLLSDAFDFIMIDIKTFMVEFELIRPDSHVIIFEDFVDSKYHSCCELQQMQLQPDVNTPVVHYLDRMDRFMSAFNIAHSAFKKAVSVPQRSGVDYKVFEGSQADAYLTMKFCTKEGGRGGSGSRTIGINPYMLGCCSGESIVDVVDVSTKVGCQAWCLVCFTLGFLYLPVIKFAAKTALITTSRRIIRVKIVSPAPGRVLDPDLTYSRVVQCFFDPCKVL
jgi:uncharacterized membrane protein YidH (DUF202 family)